MIQTFQKGVGQYLGTYREWLSTDFDCRCVYKDCQTTLIDLDLICGLEVLSDILGKPRVTSGFRCAAYNKNVGGLPDSQHLLGKASDLVSGWVSPNEIAIAAQRIPVFADGGLGLYSSFVHLDVRGHKARWGSKIKC